eukprot:4487434-Pyramimonas_sp.AAC.1
MEKESKRILLEFINSTANANGQAMIEDISRSFKVIETYKREDEDEGDRHGKLQYSLNPTPVLGAIPQGKEIGETELAWVRNFSVFKLKEAMTASLLGLNATKGKASAPKSALERAVESSLRRRQ